ncbi:hypothetical protein GGQ68_001903 [Sagittula marina]|uniref:DUF4112 domain-containing protein n=1 Tax=Sagittula marina TaxID=943940 RepID=A0A7W6DLU4_9RHOB|nr:DUF4112 domain-containing protein [Sagittula marina]MBB3985570.1 hypothetical protein [Sagittula marina]
MTLDQHMRNVDRAEKIARRMDAAFHLPGTRIRIGYDSIVGLVPGIGDTLALAPSAYIVKLAHECGASHALLGRMGVNLGIDWLIGLVPLIGDIFDVGWKANLRNAALLRAHVESLHGLTPQNPVGADSQPATANP